MSGCCCWGGLPTDLALPSLTSGVSQVVLSDKLLPLPGLHVQAG